MADILIAEDDEQIREWVAIALEADSHKVRAVSDGVAAISAYNEHRPDLLILDIMMPKKSGYDVCQELRRKDPSLPILFLTAKGTESDKVLGFSLGADDYLTKPFGVRELSARITALLRRTYASETSSRTSHNSFKIGSFNIDEKSRRLISASGDVCELTPHELALLRLFATHPGELLDRDRLLNEVWGMNYYGTTRTLDQRIAVLRKKLGSEGMLIETVYSQGYRYIGK